MKIIGLEFKKITVGKFFPKEDKVELNIFFNDGTDKEILKVVDTSDAEKSAETILMELRKLEKNIHNGIENTDFAIGNTLNIVIKEEEKAAKEIARFIQKAKIKIDEIKSRKVAEGYLDVIRELKNLKIEF